jgi:hypothetical protein
MLQILTITVIPSALTSTQHCGQDDQYLSMPWPHVAGGGGLGAPQLDNSRSVAMAPRCTSHQPPYQTLSNLQSYFPTKPRLTGAKPYGILGETGTNGAN